MYRTSTKSDFLPFPIFYKPGDIAQLARASALQAEGLGFESPYLQDVIIVKIFTDVL